MPGTGTVRFFGFTVPVPKTTFYVARVQIKNAEIALESRRRSVGANADWRARAGAAAAGVGTRRYGGVG